MPRIFPLHHFTPCLTIHSAFHSLCHHSLSLSLPVSPFIQPFTLCSPRIHPFAPCLTIQSAFHSLSHHAFILSLPVSPFIQTLSLPVSSFIQPFTPCLTIHSAFHSLSHHSISLLFSVSSPQAPFYSLSHRSLILSLPRYHHSHSLSFPVSLFHSNFYSVITTSLIVSLSAHPPPPFRSLLTTSFILSLPAHHLIHPFTPCSPPNSGFHCLPRLTTSFSPSLHFSPLNYSFIHCLSTTVSCLFPLFTPHSMLFRPSPIFYKLSLTNGRGEWQHLGSRESAVLPGPQQQLPHPQPLSPSALSPSYT